MITFSIVEKTDIWPPKKYVAKEKVFTLVKKALKNTEVVVFSINIIASIFHWWFDSDMTTIYCSNSLRRS